jgi:hypothetical protein
MVDRSAPGVSRAGSAGRFVRTLAVDLPRPWWAEWTGETISILDYDDRYW